MSHPHVRAAFINAIAEEGTKAEAIEWLQKTWNENCALRAALREIADSDVHWRAVNVARVALARAALEGKSTKKICPECGQPMREGGYCDHIPF